MESPNKPLQIYDPNGISSPDAKDESKTSSSETDTKAGVLSSCRIVGKKRKRGVQLKPRVCFVCKDSGRDLILCARKNCTKAYHPSCTGHTASFFTSNNKNWQCSSHFCMECGKASYHTCYTCTYSLCEGCKEEPGFLHVSRCKGLCKICTERVTTIEKNEQGNECKKELNLFQDYWIYVKNKASKGLIETINRLKGQHGGKLDHTNNGQVSKAGSSLELLEVSSSKRRKLSRCSVSSVLEDSFGEARMGHEEEMSMSREEEEWASKELLDFVRYMNNGDTSALSHFGVKALLLKYIKRNNLRDPHQRTQILCDSRLENLFGKACIRHFEMFRYLRTHLLKNDRQAYSIQARSSDICPSQMGISGISDPQRVLVAGKIGEVCNKRGHVLSETKKDDCAATAVYLGTKDNSKTLEKTDADEGVETGTMSEGKSPCTIPGYDAIEIQLETGDNSKPLKKTDADKEVKLCEMGENKSQQTSVDFVSFGTQLTTGDFSKVSRKAGGYKRPNMSNKGDHRSLQTNLDEYASIDPHNINLLYVRRNLLEDVLDDIDKFHDKIVGSFVRIAVESSKKQETHRLVEVVGTGKAPQPYETGARKTHFLLEILNLSTAEMVPIVDLSNEDFSEEECKCLRETMRSGSVKHTTVREVQQKAMVLQEVRAHSLEKEKHSLCSRRDFFSEKGKRKQHGECIKNLQLLEERLRSIQQIPDIHADPNFDPNDKSQEDANSDVKVQDNYTGHTEIISHSEEKNSISPGKGCSVSNDSCTGDRRSSPTALKSGESASTKHVLDRGDIANGPSEKADGSSWNPDIEIKGPVAASALDTGPCNGQIVAGSGSSDESVTTSFVSKTQKLWHYQDPSGKIQGPFSMLQLCKWSTISSFPANMRIWRNTEKQQDAVLLTAALDNTFSRLNVTGAYESKGGITITNVHHTGTVSQIC